MPFFFLHLAINAFILSKLKMMELQRIPWKTRENKKYELLFFIKLLDLSLGIDGDKDFRDFCIRTISFISPNLCKVKSLIASFD